MKSMVDLSFRNGTFRPMFGEYLGWKLVHLVLAEAGTKKEEFGEFVFKKDGGAQWDLCPHCVCYCHVDSPWAAEVAQQCAEGQEATLVHLWIGWKGSPWIPELPKEVIEHNLIPHFSEQREEELQKKRNMLTSGAVKPALRHLPLYCFLYLQNILFTCMWKRLLLSSYLAFSPVQMPKPKD